MEDVAFSILLYVIFIVCIACLVGDSGSSTTTTTVTQKVETNSKIPIEKQPIEQQCKEVFKEILTPTKVHLSDKEIEELTLRQARKVIAELNKGLSRNHKQRIRLKVNGKDQPKSWIISQIKSKLQEQPQKVEKVIRDIVAA